LFIEYRLGVADEELSNEEFLDRIRINEQKLTTIDELDFLDGLFQNNTLQRSASVPTNGSHPFGPNTPTIGTLGITNIILIVSKLSYLELYSRANRYSNPDNRANSETVIELRTRIVGLERALRMANTESEALRDEVLKAFMDM